MPVDVKYDEFMDIDLSSGDFEFISDGEEAAQYIAIQLLKIEGEDPFHPRLGLPWFNGLLSVAVSAKQKLLHIRRAILGVPEVKKINRSEIGIDLVNRGMSVEWEADSIYGVLNKVGGPDGV